MRPPGILHSDIRSALSLYLAAVLGLEAGGGAALVELVQEQLLVERYVDRMAQPAGQMHRVGQRQAVDALAAIGNQRLAAQMAPRSG